MLSATRLSLSIPPGAPSSGARRMVGGVCSALATHSHLPAVVFRLGFVLLAASTDGLGLLVYLGLWTAMPQPNDAIVPGWIRRPALAAATFFILFQMSTARGTVTLRDEPLRRADVVLLDDHAVVRTVQTDVRGKFSVWHWPTLRVRTSLVICAPGVYPLFQDPSHSAIVHGEYDLMAWDHHLSAPWPLAGIANLPTSCRAPLA